MLEKIHTSVNLLNKCHNCSQVFHLVTMNCICIAHCILESNISGSFSIFLMIKRYFRAFKIISLGGLYTIESKMNCQSIEIGTKKHSWTFLYTFCWLQFFKRINYFSLFKKHVFIFKMGFGMSFRFQNVVLFQNVLSFLKCKRFCGIFLSSEKQNEVLDKINNARIIGTIFLVWTDQNFGPCNTGLSTPFRNCLYMYRILFFFSHKNSVVMCAETC